MGCNTCKVGIITMTLFNRHKKSISAALAILLASSNLLADLVWTKGKGWEVQGGALSNFVGNMATSENALDAMNKAKEAEEDEDLWTALNYYKHVVNEFTNSIFAPEAYFQMGKIYGAKGMFSDANKAFERIIRHYPEYPKYNLVISEEYKLAQRVQSGQTPYMWGWLPWFSDYKEGIDFYEKIVSNAPYSDYAPMALMNISLLAQKIESPELSLDALDRLISTYPQSIFTPDAYLEMAKTYREMVQGPEYDQASAQQAKSFYEDFLILFPEDNAAVHAEQGLEYMQDTIARSRLIIGDFYYVYRNDNKAAVIFYNEAITAAPRSLAAQEARDRINEISDGKKAMLNPVDWFFGRYKDPDFDVFEESKAAKTVDPNKYQDLQPQDFIENKRVPEGVAKFMPIAGEDLDAMLNSKGTLEDQMPEPPEENEDDE